jgi:hypothetical protein
MLDRELIVDVDLEFRRSAGDGFDILFEENARKVSSPSDSRIESRASCSMLSIMSTSPSLSSLRPACVPLMDWPLLCSEPEIELPLNGLLLALLMTTASSSRRFFGGRPTGFFTRTSSWSDNLLPLDPEL